MLRQRVWETPAGPALAHPPATASPVGGHHSRLYPLHCVPLCTAFCTAAAGDWHCSAECERIRSLISASVQGQQMEIPGFPNHTWQVGGLGLMHSACTRVYCGLMSGWRWDVSGWRVSLTVIVGQH